jgi:Rne/Rng family ribonuclease
MTKEMFVSSTPHETKLAIVEDGQLAEVYFERANEYTLAGSIYKGRVTRVLPGMQSAFVDVGLERDAFLYVSDFFEMGDDEDQDEFEQVMVSRPQTAFQLKPEPVPPPQPVFRAEPEEDLEEEESDEGETEAATGDATSAETRDDMTPEGARRWRGRNRRRRGRRGRPFPEPRLGPRPVPREETPPEAPRRPAHEFTPAPTPYPPIVLPGESISKYRHVASEERAPETEAPHAAPTEPLPATILPETQTVPEEHLESASLAEQAEAATETTSAQAHPSQERHSPREYQPLVLPGESISKYRNRSSQPVSTAARVEVAEVEPAEVKPAEVQQEHVEAPPVEEQQPPEPEALIAAPEQQPAEEQKIEQMNVAAVFGAEAAEAGTAPEPPATENPEWHQAAMHEELPQSQTEPTAMAETQPAVAEPRDETPSAEQAAAHGATLEEEEVEDEDEFELPAIGEELDDTHFEELEEETLHAHAYRGEPRSLPVGEQLTEAVEESAEEREALEEEYEEDEDEEDDESLDIEEAENLAEQIEGQPNRGEDNGSRAELRAPTGTAGFQQRTDRGKYRDQQRRGRRGGKGRPSRRDNEPRQNIAIADLLKEGQEVLIQIAKEPIGKKGARITSHIALPGRFLVYMPTVHHIGVSRKIASDEERLRLKRIVGSEIEGAHGGFIVRTAAEGVKEDELRADIRFLKNLWTEIKTRADNSRAPALIYHDLNLVERILRDQVTQDFSQIWVDNEQEYERVLRFLNRFQPGLVRRVKLYTKATPLFEQFDIQDEINKSLKSKVWLKSGGYIVINQTEALVAIDINTGKYVGKTARLEDTIVKTNVDAIREIVRQIRLRDLGGIIVIDFIDMDERRNRQKVMQALEEALKSDRSPSKVLQFNDFGLVAITRKRVKQSLERTLCTPCEYCAGTGMVKSVATICNEIYTELRKITRQLEKGDVMLRVNPEVAKELKGNGARWLQEYEELVGRTVLVKSDPTIHQEQFDIN